MHEPVDWVRWWHFVAAVVWWWWNGWERRGMAVMNAWVRCEGAMGSPGRLAVLHYMLSRWEQCRPAKPNEVRGETNSIPGWIRPDITVTNAKRLYYLLRKSKFDSLGTLVASTQSSQSTGLRYINVMTKHSKIKIDDLRTLVAITQPGQSAAQALHYNIRQVSGDGRTVP